ncbi:MAG: TonB-dependent receptor [Blastocatellia bacterium]
MRLRFSQMIVTGALLLWLAGTGAAQAIKGTLLGNVTDSSGAAAASASVTITETRTGVSNTTTANADGYYVFSNLQDGVYRVEATAQGFRKVIRDNIEVKVNTTLRIDLALEVGAVTDTVTITTEAPLLQTDRADTGRLIEAKQVAELPLGNNRNFQNLLVTVPGATRPTRPHSEFFNPQDSLESKVNGQSRLSNNFQIEGVDDNHRTGLLTVLIPAADAIETVSIATSNFDAEFGRAGGAVSNVTLKSGTNDLHGSAFIFGNNDNTLANGFFTRRKAATHYRQYGFTLGGPIIKNKLFFFGDYQRTSDKLGRVNLLTIPIADWRAGNFANIATKIYDPLTGNADGTGRQQISCNGVLNVICPNRISPIAQKLLAFLPAPNIAGAGIGQNNFRIDTVRVKTIHAFDVKLNFNPNDRNTISGRLSFQQPEIFDPGSFGVYGGPANGGFAGSGTQRTWSTATNYTRTFNPTLIAEFRFGLSTYRNTALSQGDGLKTSEEVGIKNANPDAFTSGLTQININGFSNPLLGFSASLPWDRGETTVNFTGVVTKMAGNHTLKMGAEWRRNRDFLLQLQDNGGVRGRFTFGGAQTGLPSDSASLNGLANAFASFLLDVPGSIGRDIRVIDNPGTRHKAFFSFVHDKWQVSKKMTLDLGLRHEFYTPFTGIESKGGLSNYDPTNNTVRVAGYGSVPDNLGVNRVYTNFAPRLGASYRFADKTVIRAGFGTTIMPFPNNVYAFNFPVKQNNQFNPPNSFAAAGSMNAGFPAPVVFNIPADGIIDASNALLRNSGLIYIPSDLREGRLHAWNVAFQRELWFGFSGEIAYVGNVAKGAIYFTDLNAGQTPGQDNAGRPFNVKFGRTASVNSTIGLDSPYHSLQAKVDRRFSKGLLINTSYTFGRAINYAEDNGSIATPANIELSRGRGDFDRRHMFSTNFVWDLPFFRQGNRLVKGVLGGWQVSGIFVAQSGTPISFTADAASLRAPGNTQRPNVNGTPKIPGGIGPGALYFDTSVFSAPAANTFGNMKRNDSITGPGYVNLDGSLFKRFAFTERIRAELRADLFNLTNTPHFNNPGGAYGSSTFGQVTSAFGERLVRFGARVTF